MFIPGKYWYELYICVECCWSLITQTQLSHITVRDIWSHTLYIQLHVHKFKLVFSHIPSVIYEQSLHNSCLRYMSQPKGMLGLCSLSFLLSIFIFCLSSFPHFLRQWHAHTYITPDLHTLRQPMTDCPTCRDAGLDYRTSCHLEMDDEREGCTRGYERWMQWRNVDDETD